MANLSHTQIDRLGDRLGEGSLTESDLRLLDDYRRSFGVAYETVVRTIREALQLEPTGRPAKSTSSLIEKLRRESIRLSQVQDITGCRIVVADIGAQERVVASLCGVFPGASVIDRRMNPSYGYRAVHVIARVSGKVVEIQVRTMLQSLWAALSEKCSDIIDPQIKYGGGDDAIRERLALASEAMARLERLQDMAGQEDPHVSEQHRQVITEETILILAQIADMCGMMLAHWGTKRVSSHDPPT